jgi:flagellar basal body-associated protein FliL
MPRERVGVDIITIIITITITITIAMTITTWGSNKGDDAMAGFRLCNNSVTTV